LDGNIACWAGLVRVDDSYGHFESDLIRSVCTQAVRSGWIHRATRNLSWVLSVPSCLQQRSTGMWRWSDWMHSLLPP